jgi:hypothetical protein
VTPQLATGTRDMALDGVKTDEQMNGNFLIPHSCRNETQDFDPSSDMSNCD